MRINILMIFRMYIKRHKACNCTAIKTFKSVVVIIWIIDALFHLKLAHKIQKLTKYIFGYANVFRNILQNISVRNAPSIGSFKKIYAQKAKSNSSKRYQ